MRRIHQGGEGGGGVKRRWDCAVAGGWDVTHRAEPRHQGIRSDGRGCCIGLGLPRRHDALMMRRARHLLATAPQ
jgi:hypothetical protein